MPSMSQGALRYAELTSASAPAQVWSEAVAFVDARMAQDGAHDWGHLGRVYVNARAIHEREDSGDWDVLALAALFHDVVNLPKNHPDRAKASELAAEVARGWLAEATWRDDDARARVAEAIRCHSFSRGETATSPEAMMLSDADRLDAIGAVGIARCFIVGANLGREPWHPNDPLATARAPDQDAWGVDHFFEKLLKLAPNMYTAAGKALARERHDTMLRFLEALADEVGAPREPMAMGGVSSP